MAKISPFTDVQAMQVPLLTGNLNGSSYITNLKKMSVGAGSQVVRSDRSGLWAGDKKFSTAPFSVDMQGNVTLSSATVSGYIPTGGALTDIGSLGITSTYIANDAITTPKIAANAIEAGKIAANAVTTAKLDASAVTAEKIATNAITADKILAGAVTAAKISVTTLSAIVANLGTVTAGTITGLTISAGTGGGGGGISVWGDAISYKNTGGLTTGTIFGSGFNLRIEAVVSGLIQTNAMINFDNVSGVGISIPDCIYAVKGADVEIDNGLGVGNGIYINSGGLHVDSGDITCYDFKLDSTGSRFVFKDTGGTERLSLVPDGTNSELRMNGYSLKLTSNKTAIVPTSQGYKALYCIESPEVWFVDFVEKLDKEDPLFQEVTIGKTKIIELVGGGYQIWRRRRGHEHLRFESKTEAQFIKNENFLRQAR